MAPCDSPAMKAQRVQDSLYDTLGAPLKKVQRAYLLNVAKDCYPEHHMAEDFTNAEQIKLCREKLHTKYFGSFMTSLENVRLSTQFHY